MKSIFVRLGKESVIYGVGGIIGRFVGFFLLPIYTRVFSTATYGVMDVISTTTSLFSVLLTSGIADSALSYYFFDRPSHDERRKTVVSLMVYIMALASVVAAAVWVFAAPLCSILFKSTQNAPFLKIAIAAIPFTCINSMHYNLLRLQRRPGAYIGFSLAQLFSSAGLTILFVVVIKMGVIGVFKANLIVSVFFFFIGAYINRSFLGHFFNRKRLVELVRYGLPLVVGGLAMCVILYLDRYFLVRLTSIDSVGIYSVGLKVASAMAFVTGSFRLANAPFQLEIAKAENAKDVYVRTLRYFSVGTAWCLVGLSLAARPILSIITTQAYESAFVIVPIAAFTAVVDGLTQIISVGLLVKEKTKNAGIAMIVGALANIALLPLMIPIWGIVGAALSIMLANIAMLVVFYFASQRAYHIPFNIKRLVFTYASAAFFIFAGLIIESGKLETDLAIATVGVLSWPFFAFVTGIIRREETTKLITVIKGFSSAMAGNFHQ